MTNLLQQLINSNGTPAVNGDKPVTLGDVLVSALLETPASQHPLSPDEKLKRYATFKRIQGKTEVEFAPDEIDLIKQAAGPLYTALTLGQIYEMLGAQL